MGIFDLFTGGSIDKQIEKHSKRIKKKDAQQEDRVASAYWLAEEGSFNSVYGLLGRFEMAYEHRGVRRPSQTARAAHRRN